jgi:hypothetical protein
MLLFANVSVGHNHQGNDAIIVSLLETFDSLIELWPTDCRMKIVMSVAQGE